MASVVDGRERDVKIKIIICNCFDDDDRIVTMIRLEFNLKLNTLTVSVRKVDTNIGCWISAPTPSRVAFPQAQAADANGKRRPVVRCRLAAAHTDLAKVADGGANTQTYTHTHCEMRGYAQGACVSWKSARILIRTTH